MLPESLAHDGQDVLRRERFIGILQGAMERPDVSNERCVCDVGIVDGPTDQAFVQDVATEVEHALAEPVGAGGAAVVHDVRGQDRHPRPGRAAMRASRSYRMAPWSTMNTVQVSWVCGGYAWSTNRAWKTSWMPGTAGFHARTHSRSVAKTARSYKTLSRLRALDGVMTIAG